MLCAIKLMYPKIFCQTYMYVACVGVSYNFCSWTTTTTTTAAAAVRSVITTTTTTPPTTTTSTPTHTWPTYSARWSDVRRAWSDVVKSVPSLSSTRSPSTARRRRTSDRWSADYVTAACSTSAPNRSSFANRTAIFFLLFFYRAICVLPVLVACIFLQYGIAL